MYGNKKVDNTLNPNFMTPFLKNAQIAEFYQLLKIIEEMYSKTNRQLKVLDIGVGDARIPLMLSKSNKWSNINLFVGIENSQIEVDKAVKAVEDAGLEEKVSIVNLDALNIETQKNALSEQNYDLIICTYFTPGNFKPGEIDINKIPFYSKELLKPNKNFAKVFKSAYEMLNSGGVMLLGSIYIDTNENRRRQEEFYKKCGMSVVTSSDDEFTATKEGFWSERFTKEKIFEYFYWVTKENIKIIPLDNYNFAESVVISKP